MPLAGVLASLIFFGCGLKQEAAEPEQSAYVWIPKKVYFTYVCCYNTASFPRAIGEPNPGESSVLKDDDQSTSFSCSRSPREKGSGTKAAPMEAVPACTQVSTLSGSSLLTGHGHRARLLGSSPLPTPSPDTEMPARCVPSRRQHNRALMVGMSHLLLPSAQGCHTRSLLSLALLIACLSCFTRFFFLPRFPFWLLTFSSHPSSSCMCPLGPLLLPLPSSRCASIPWLPHTHFCFVPVPMAHVRTICCPDPHQNSEFNVSDQDFYKPATPGGHPACRLPWCNAGPQR